MKTDIAGSTPKFRALLATDQQALLREHRAFVDRHAADHHGRIVQSAGDGYWLEFPSVTGAARSAIAMQDALRLAQPRKGDDRLSIRIVIGLGDIAVLEESLVGDVIPLMVRIETITPADEIYLTSAANLVLAPAEIQTAFVNDFLLQGFPDPVAVYRIQQRHRTLIVPNAYILVSDLRGSIRLIAAQPVAKVEAVLNTLDDLTTSVAREFGGTIRYNSGDSYCMTYTDAAPMVAAASRLSQEWKAADDQHGFECAINIALNRGTICTIRSFIYGDGLLVTTRVESASTEALVDGEGGVFVTDTVRDDLLGSLWYEQLVPVALKRLERQFPALKVYRLVARAAG